MNEDDSPGGKFCHRRIHSLAGRSFFFTTGQTLRGSQDEIRLGMEDSSCCKRQEELGREDTIGRDRGIHKGKES